MAFGNRGLSELPPAEVEAAKRGHTALLIPLTRFADVAARHPGQDGFAAYLAALDAPAIAHAVAARRCVLLFDGSSCLVTSPCEIS